MSGAGDSSLSDPSRAETGLWKPWLVWFMLTVSLCGLPPSEDAGFFNGLPIDHPTDFVAAILLFVLVFISPIFTSGRTLRRLMVIVFLAALCRLAAFSVSPSLGLNARYLCESSPGNFQLQRSIDTPSRSTTKIDSDIDFSGVSRGCGRKPVWAEFLNGGGFEAYSLANRLQYRLRITWTGFIQPDRDCQIQLESNGNGAVSSETRLEQARIYPFRAEVLFESLGDPRVELITLDSGEAVPETWLFREPPATGAVRMYVGFLWLSRFFFAAMGFFLILSLWRQRRSGDFSWRYVGYGAVLLIALLQGVLLWEHKLADNPHLSVLRSNDYLYYEAEARTILLDGLFQTWPYPFHRCAGMGVYLAMGHLIFGESSYGIVLFQQVVRGLTGICYLLIWVGLCGWSPVAWAVALMVLFLPAGAALSLNLRPVTTATFLAGAVLFNLLKSERLRDSRKPLLYAGCLAGLLTLLRTNAIVLLPAISLWLLLRRRRLSRSLLFVLPFAFVLLWVPLRNRVVAGQWVWIPTQGPLNLVLGNNIPAELDVSQIRFGSEREKQVFLSGLSRLLDFENNPRATFDPFPETDNAKMQKPLMAVFLSYLHTYPAHFTRQTLTRIQCYFLPFGTDRAVLAITLGMLVGIFLLVREDRFGTWATVLLFILVYSLPLVLSHFLARHRFVILPPMILIAAYAVQRLLGALSEVKKRQPDFRVGYGSPSGPKPGRTRSDLP